MAHNTIARWLAIATGVGASAGALFVLLKDDVRAGQWSDAFVLVPITLGIAVLTGHLVGAALRHGKLLAAIGFSLSFALSTGLTIYQSAGKQAETSDSRMASAEMAQRRVAAKHEELAAARSRRDAALERVDDCRTKCDGKRRTAREAQADVARIEADLVSMGAPPPVAAKAERTAQVVAVLTGLDAQRVKDALVLVEPFAVALLFELTAIVALGFGFGHAPPARIIPQPAAMVVTTRQEDAADEDARTVTTADNVIELPVVRRDAVAEWVREFYAERQRAPTDPEIAARFPGVPKTSRWRYRRQAVA